MGQSVLPEGAAAHLPAARAAGKRRVEGARALPVEPVAQSERVRRAADAALGRLAQQPLAAAVDQPEPAVPVEGEDGDVDLLDHPPEQRGGLELPQALAPQRLAQRVHLEQREPEGVVGAGAAGPDRVVALAQRGEQIGDGLERAHHPLAQQQRTDQPGADREQGEGEPDAQGMIAGPEQPGRHQHRRQAGGEGAGEDARLVTSVVAAG